MQSGNAFRRQCHFFRREKGVGIAIGEGDTAIQGMRLTTRFSFGLARSGCIICARVRGKQYSIGKLSVAGLRAGDGHCAGKQCPESVAKPGVHCRVDA